MEILTPFQKQILSAIGSSALASTFYLTGGTALAAYYLQHRFSEDLAMQNVKKIQFLPRMIKPVEIADLQTFFLNLAQELMAEVAD